MFGRRKAKPAQSPSDPVGPPAEIYTRLRDGVFTSDPAKMGLSATAALPHVWGGVLETTYDDGTFTLIALADGTTSFYTSDGGGMVGGGGHPAVVAANHTFLETIEALLAEFAPDETDSRPGPEQVCIWAFTYDGRRSARGAENDFGNLRLPASPAFHAAHAVLTEFRLIDEARNSG